MSIRKYGPRAVSSVPLHDHVPARALLKSKQTPSKGRYTWRSYMPGWGRSNNISKQGGVARGVAQDRRVDHVDERRTANASFIVVEGSQDRVRYRHWGGTCPSMTVNFTLVGVVDL